MSPGINDPHTAITCIHWLGAGLSIIGNKGFPSIVRRDKNGFIRVISKEYDYGNIVDACFDHLRLYAQSNIFVSLEILIAIRKAIEQAKQPELRDALQQKARIIVEQLHSEVKHKTEAAKVEEHFKAIMFAYGNKV